METLKNYPEQPENKLIRRNWEDENLPENLETFSFTSKFNGYKKDENEDLFYADLPEIGFSVSKEKLDSVGAQKGDMIRIEKLAQDPTYFGDGIIKIVNETKRLSATIKNWEENRQEEWEEIRKAA